VAPSVLGFDAACRDVIKTCALGCGLRSAAWSTTPMPDGVFHHLAAGGAKGRLVILDEETLKPMWDTRDTRQAITDLKYNPAGSVLAAACADRHVYLYAVAVQRYSKLATCGGHSSVMRHVDWSRDGAMLQSNCSAYEALAFSVTGKQVTASQRNTAWHTWTCTLGFPVMAIWPADADGTDVNSADRDPGGALAATADDRGAVKLFNYPCVVDDAPHRAYAGHASHVAYARFSADGGQLASAGGADRTVLQFRVVDVEPPPEPEAAREPVLGTLDGKVFGWHPDAVATAGAEGAAGIWTGGDGVRETVDTQEDMSRTGGW
jgi:echinoderm microtubule-associated protein-like 6